VRHCVTYAADRHSLGGCLPDENRLARSESTETVAEHFSVLREQDSQVPPSVLTPRRRRLSRVFAELAYAARTP